MNNKWTTLYCGVKLLRAPLENTLNDTYEKDIHELGYNRNELYPMDNFSTNPTIIGYFKLITNELIAIHRDDDVLMCTSDVERFKNSLFSFSEIDETDALDEGINNLGISQKYIEEICGKSAINNIISNGKYNFYFEDGFLVKYDSCTGYSAKANQFLNIDDYYAEAKRWYGKDEVSIIKEINLQAQCLCEIDIAYLKSSSIKRKFSYPNMCCNYIAMAAHYKFSDLEPLDIINSFHGHYDILEDSSMYQSVKAYGEKFTFLNLELPAQQNLDYSEETTISSNGYIYVMINPSLPNMVKIGKTTRHPEERVKELSSATGVPTPFILVFYKDFSDCHIAEKVIHNVLEKRGVRVSGNREFFQISSMEAIELVELYKQVENDNI